VWFPDSFDSGEKELKGAFQSQFGAAWDEVLDAADRSFPYNASNDAYFAVSAMRPLENLSLTPLLKREGRGPPLSVILS